MFDFIRNNAKALSERESGVINGISFSKTEGGRGDIYLDLQDGEKREVWVVPSVIGFRDDFFVYSDWFFPYLDYESV